MRNTLHHDRDGGIGVVKCSSFYILKCAIIISTIKCPHSATHTDTIITIATRNRVCRIREREQRPPPHARIDSCTSLRSM